MVNRLKINLFTPSPSGVKLIFFAPHGAGVNEENQWLLCIIPDTHFKLLYYSFFMF